MKSITTIERNNYLLIKNPDLIKEYKILPMNHIIGSGERALFFGELQVYEKLNVEGELEILEGSIYSETLNQNIDTDTILYGTVTVDGEIEINSELSVI